MLSDGVKWNVYDVVDEGQYRKKGGDQDVYKPKLDQIKKQDVVSSEKGTKQSIIQTSGRRRGGGRRSIGKVMVMATPTGKGQQVVPAEIQQRFLSFAYRILKIHC